MNETYVIRVNDEEQGPYSFDDLKMYEDIGEISPMTQVRLNGHDIWKDCGRVKATRNLEIERLRAYVELPKAKEIPNTPPRSRGVYVILGLFFGCLGVHNFYAGRFGPGVAQLLIAICLGWVFGLGLFITAIWALIDLLVIVEDGNGVPFY